MAKTFDSSNSFKSYYQNNKAKDNNNRKKDYDNTGIMDLKPMELPEEFVQKAEDVMIKVSRKITTSKLRGIYSLVSKIYNVENIRTENDLLPESMDTIQMIRIRIVYEAGRDESKGVRAFIDESHILNYLKDIGNSRTKFIKFARYMEALVAYHKFCGGRD